MYTVVRFSLHGAGEQGYRDAFEVLAGLGLTGLAGVDPTPHAHAGAGCSVCAAVVGETSGAPDEVTRNVFAALQAARLAPVAVLGRQLEGPPPLAS